MIGVEAMGVGQVSELEVGERVAGRGGRCTARPEQGSRLEEAIRNRQGEEGEMLMGEIWGGGTEKEAFVQYASSNNPEDADETDLGSEKTEREIGGERKYRIARDMDSKHH